MALHESRQGDVTLVQARGRLDAATASETDRRLASFVSAGARRIVLNLSGVDYVSSAGLRVLLAAAKRLQQAQGKLVLADPTPQTRQILDMAGFSALIPVFDTAEAAVASLSTSAPHGGGPRASLSLAEEVFLLALDDRLGLVRPGLLPALDYALAGAVLMDLALRGRIDTDATSLKVVMAAPAGDEILDDVLREIRARPEAQPVSFWLQELASPSHSLQERSLEGLLRKGILKREDRRLLWVFEVHRYPVADDREVKEVRTRLRDLILGDELPGPRDVVLLNLGNACRLLEDLLTPQDRERTQARIAALSRLDLIGQEMSRVIRDVETTLAVSRMPGP